jgi:hypothetical protein
VIQDRYEAGLLTQLANVVLLLVALVVLGVSFSAGSAQFLDLQARNFQLLPTAPSSKIKISNARYDRPRDSRPGRQRRLGAI